MGRALSTDSFRTYPTVTSARRLPDGMRALSYARRVVEKRRPISDLRASGWLGTDRCVERSRSILRSDGAQFRKGFCVEKLWQLAGVIRWYDQGCKVSDLSCTPWRPRN